MRASEKCLIGTNRIWRFSTSDRLTVYITPKSPKGGTKHNFAVLPVKFNFCRKKSAAKFLCVETSRGKVGVIVSDVPVYLKFALKVIHPFRKSRF